MQKSIMKRDSKIAEEVVAEVTMKEEIPEREEVEETDVEEETSIRRLSVRKMRMASCL